MKESKEQLGFKTVSHNDKPHSQTFIDELINLILDPVFSFSHSTK